MKNPVDAGFFMEQEISRNSLFHKKALTCQRCALARRCRLSQATARGARMCQGTLFFGWAGKKLPVFTAALHFFLRPRSTFSILQIPAHTSGKLRLGWSGSFLCGNGGVPFGVQRGGIPVPLTSRQAVPQISRGALPDGFR